MSKFQPGDDLTVTDSLLLLTLFAFGFVLRIVALQYGWEWHLEPLGMPHIDRWQAFAIVLVVGLIYQSGGGSLRAKEEQTRARLYSTTIAFILVQVLAIGVLWWIR